MISRRDAGHRLIGLALGGMAATRTGFTPRVRAAALSSRVAVVPARVVRNGWGVCGRPGIDADAEAYAAMMGQLGTRDLRAPMVQGGRDNGARFRSLRQALARAGLGERLRVTALVGAYLNDAATTWQVQQAALLSFATDGATRGLLRAIEGPNEINNRAVGGGSHGPADLVDRTDAALVPANFQAWAEAIHDFRARHPVALDGVTLVSPSIASGLRSDYARLPDVTAFVDAANFHFYAGAGRQPGFSMAPNPDVGAFDNVLAWARDAQRPAGPVWQTEAGATNSGNYARDGISQAKYLANQLCDFFAAGGTRIFYYQLIDGSGRDGDVEGNFGLFHRDGTPKPAAVMFAGLKHLLSVNLYDDHRNDADTAPLTAGYDARRLVVVGEPHVPRVLVMPKSDGSTMIAVWNEPVIDDGKGHSLAVAAAMVQLDFGSVETFSVHDPMARTPLTGTTPRGTQFDTGRSVSVALAGHPLLIELRPPVRGG